ncbi:type VI secretion system baseplate subunit TssG [Vibrio gigantis]|uniref:type VI secretion system baseplate subunit TssG n=1 Tax=Vibrio TaxID=662 RepID=UPI001EFB545F|nr:type VI secretion system baseplate subunit TssG [Vibrio gigantis]ULN63019.1 type VI secretion system baseplate subunit TssG [Vibrio gigantis]
MKPFVQDLANQPEKYDFTQAMRLLEQLQAQSTTPFQIQLKSEAMPTGNPQEIQYFSLKGNKAKLRLAKQALSGVKGVIPNYIYEELLAAIHNEDHSLQDFLDVFNQRHYEITYRTNARRWLLVESEQNPKKTALLNHFAALGKEHKEYLQYSLLLSQQSRSLTTLKKILNDYFPYSIDVECKAFERRLLPADSLTRIGTDRDFNSRLGQGFLVGRTCLAHFNNLSIFVTPKNRNEFLEIQQDDQFAKAVLSLTQHYLKDSTPVAIYLNVKRSYLTRPRLSSKVSIAARLGEIDYLAPERSPNETVKILLL